MEIIETYSQKFKEDNKLNNISFEVEQSIINKNDFSKNIIDANVQVELGIMMRSYIDDITNENALIPSNLGLADVSINNSVDIYNKLTLERTEELKTATADNPEVQNLTNRIAKLKVSIIEGIDNLISSKEKILEQYESENRNIRNNLSLLPGYEKNYRSIQRQQEIKETLYLYLLEKREENQIAMSMGIGNAKIVDPAYSSNSIVYPRPKMFYTAAVLFSILLFFIIIYLKGLLNDKVYSKKDIDQLGLPYIGNIPQGEKNRDIVITKGSKTAISEAFRTLRTNIDFMMTSGPEAKIIFITSSVAKEGKSFTAVNFSMSLALSGKKVLILGMDLRAPKLEDYMGNERSKGITNYIIDSKNNFKDYIYTTQINENIDVLPSGDIPPNPSELLMDDKIQFLFNDIASSYEYIIVDTAPVGIVTDTLLISKFSDVTIYVVRAHQLPRKMLNIPCELMQNKRLPNMSVLLNGTHGYKGYGYGYG